MQPDTTTLVDHVYSSLLGESSWQGFLDELRHILPDGRATVVIHDADRSLGAFQLCCSGLSPKDVADYNSYYASRNPWMRGAATRPVGRAVTAESMLTRSDLRRTEFYCDYLRPLEVATGVGVTLFREEGLNFQLSVNGPEVSEDELDRARDSLRLLVPHLQRAFQFYRRLARAEGALSAFEQMGCGGIVLDFLGRVIRINPRAERLLGDGLTISHKHLVASHKAANAALQLLIAGAIRTGPVAESAPSDGVAIQRRSGRPLIAHAAPIVGAASDLLQHGKAIILLVDPDEHREPAGPLLRQAFGLSPVEAGVALDFLRLHDIEAVAADRGISVSTARQYLKSIFAKTDTHRQAELLGLLQRIGLTPSQASARAAKR